MYLKKYIREIDNEGWKRTFDVVVNMNHEENATVVIFMEQEQVEISRSFNYPVVAGYEKIGFHEGYSVDLSGGDSSARLDDFMQAYFMSI